MMLGAIGLVFFLANGLGWADTQVAATFALTLLFLRTPLLQGIGALPTLLSAQVAFDKIAALKLAAPDAAFPLPSAPRAWQRIELEQVSFHYQGRAVSPSARSTSPSRRESNSSSSVATAPASRPWPCC